MRLCYCCCCYCCCCFSTLRLFFPLGYVRSVYVSMYFDWLSCVARNCIQFIYLVFIFFSTSPPFEQFVAWHIFKNKIERRICIELICTQTKYRYLVHVIHWIHLFLAHFLSRWFVHRKWSRAPCDCCTHTTHDRINRNHVACVFTIESFVYLFLLLLLLCFFNLCNRNSCWTYSTTVCMYGACFIT